MNNEEKYKTALETVQEILSSGADAIRIKTLKLRLQSVFPELKESEEKVREDIISLVNEFWERIGSINPEYSSRSRMIAWLEKQSKRLDADEVIEWLGKHIQVDEPKIEYNEDGQPLAESFIAHAKARCVAADEVVKKFEQDFGL